MQPPASPFVYVASGADTYISASSQVRLTGSVGNVKIVGPAGSTVILA